MHDAHIGSLDEAVDRAVAALAGLLSAGKDDIIVLEKEDTTWGDASLGWPEPGRSYAMMLVDGYRVVLGAGGKRYEFRFGGGQAMVKSAGQ